MAPLVSDAATAATLLASQGMEGGLFTDSAGTWLKSRRVWVEAYVPYSNYRGMPADQTGSTWIPLDPARSG